MAWIYFGYSDEKSSSTEEPNTNLKCSLLTGLIQELTLVYLKEKLEIRPTL